MRESKYYGHGISIENLNRIESNPATQPYFELISCLLKELMSEYGSDLISVVLYGSLARGNPHPYSDLDLILVIRDLPSRYSQRISKFLKISTKLAKLQIQLWRSRGIYSTIQPILFTPQEARMLRPLYLDLIHDSLILLDRDGFMAKVLQAMKRRMAEMGARKIMLPDGTWYWELDPEMDFGMADLDEAE